MVDFTIENMYRNEQCSVICGVDEAGRGPLAGPVYAAAVILKPETNIEGLDDSKKLTEKKREVLFPIIQEKAVAYGIGFATEQEIDEINILNATFLAMRRAVEQLSIQPDLLLIDGNQKPKIGICEEVTVVKGDAKSMSIAAASVLAKVSRDRFMLGLAETYPQYAFEKHKGYGTRLHYEKIDEYGISPVHRKTFLKKIIGENANG
ncbi:MAG: ribonuclease HII [Candidatus Fimenecus sp.]